jgi:acyl-CoA thioesterase-1
MKAQMNSWPLEWTLISRIFQIPCLAVLLVLFFWSGCSEEADPIAIMPDPEPNLTVLALGDSYTVGHSLPQQWSWPFQLADSLSVSGDALRNLAVIAQTGWTTRDLLDAIRDSLDAGRLQIEPFSMATLMIGVNNQFQGVDTRVFEAELDTLISLALQMTDGNPERLLGFSIPDYGVTPVGELFGPDRIGREIQIHNFILARKFGERDIVMIDITALSRLAATEPQLVARDGLHYSREMYRRWVALMLPSVRSCLRLSD